MTTQDFAFWLQGFVELHGQPPTEIQWQQIKDHLDLVFKKETPDILLSKSKRKIFDLLTEGPICGLVSDKIDIYNWTEDDEIKVRKSMGEKIIRGEDGKLLPFRDYKEKDGEILLYNVASHTC